MSKASTTAERIKYLTELLRLSWVTLLAVGSGAISMLLTAAEVLQVGLAAAGTMLALGLLTALLRLDRHIRRLIEKA